MIRARHMRRSLHRCALGVGVSVLLGFPAGAAAASLRITVSPASVRPGRQYVIKATGSFTQREVHGTAYLWEFLQYTAAACRPTAQAENALPASTLSFDFAGKERGSPFTRIDHWKAGPHTGLRHVCAYLYPQVVSARSGVRPIAKADTRYRDV